MEKKNTVLIILLVILSLSVVGLGGFIIYDKLLIEDVNEKDEEITSKYQYNLTKRTEIQAVSAGNIEVVVDTEGNAYLTVIGNLNNIADEDLKNNLLRLEKNFRKYSPKNYASYDEKTLNASKLDVDNVLTAYFVVVGNSGSGYFVFVKENGTLSYLSNDSLIYNGEIILKDINNLDNVVSIVQNDYTKIPYVINLDGTEISLYDYIK